MNPIKPLRMMCSSAMIGCNASAEISVKPFTKKNSINGKYIEPLRAWGSSNKVANKDWPSAIADRSAIKNVIVIKSNVLIKAATQVFASVKS